MAPRKQDVTDAELAVLRLLWARGEATIRELRETLYPEGGTSAHATVQKLLERLQAKGCVSRRKHLGSNRYRSRVDREALIGRELEQLADKLCEGSVAPLISHLVRREHLKPDEIESLRGLVDDLDRRAPSRQKPEEVA